MNKKPLFAAFIRKLVIDKINYEHEVEPIGTDYLIVSEDSTLYATHFFASRNVTLTSFLLALNEMSLRHTGIKTDFGYLYVNIEVPRALEVALSKAYPKLMVRGATDIVHDLSRSQDLNLWLDWEAVQPSEPHTASMMDLAGGLN